METVPKDVMPSRGSLDSVSGGSRSDATRDSDQTDLRTTARRALEFQRGYLRRRWATYYAVWACAVVAYFLLPFLLSFTGFSTLPGASQILILATIDFVVSIAAVFESVLTWGLAERTFALRSATDGRLSLVGPRNLIRFVIVLAVIIAAFAISTRSNFATYVLVDTVLLVLALLLLLHLHRAFRPIPPEGWLAAGTFIAAAALSYLSLFLFDSTFAHEIAWSAAVVVWFGCAAYARFGAQRDSGGPE